MVIMIALVDKEERANAYTAAVLEQLNAEIAAQNLDVKTVAERMSMDYGTFRRYTKGLRPMPMTKLWQALDVLSLDYGVFTARASERLAESGEAGKRTGPE